MTAVLDSGQRVRVGRALRMPCVADAQRRRRVLARSRGVLVAGALVYWPDHRTGKRGKGGARAVIRLDSGAHISLPPRQVVLA